VLELNKLTHATSHGTHLQTETYMEITVKRVKKVKDSGKDTGVEGDTDVDNVAAWVILTLGDRLGSGSPVNTAFTKGGDAWVMERRNDWKEEGRSEKERNEERCGGAHGSGVKQ